MKERIMIIVKRLAMLALLLGLGSAAQAQGDPMLVNGAGATFPYPIYSKWFDEYHKLHPNIQINYQSIGSGGGIRQLLAGDRKSTRLNSSHLVISYAVFCLKKKNIYETID